MLTTTLVPDDAPRAARRLVAACCSRAAVGSTCSESAALLTSEVVTNALVHGGGPVFFAVDCGPVRVRVEVGDGSSSGPTVPAGDHAAEGGRGMLIVEALASDWGVQSTPTGKIVWFEVPTQP